MSRPAYHARAAASLPREPLCGARGIDRFKTVVLGPKEWNATSRESRCQRCVAAIQKRREGKRGSA